MKLIEEATEKGHSLPERYLSHIRARCEKLQIKHPDIPPNPNAWVKDVRSAREKMKFSSKRNLKSLKDGVFH